MAFGKYYISVAWLPRLATWILIDYQEPSTPNAIGHRDQMEWISRRDPVTNDEIHLYCCFISKPPEKFRRCYTMDALAHPALLPVLIQDHLDVQAAAVAAVAAVEAAV
jgi:hypothetical protein